MGFLVGVGKFKQIDRPIDKNAVSSRNTRKAFNYMSLLLKGLPAGLDRPDSGNMKQAFVISFVSYVFNFFISVLNILLEFKVLRQLLRTFLKSSTAFFQTTSCTCASRTLF